MWHTMMVWGYCCHGLVLCPSCFCVMSLVSSPTLIRLTCPLLPCVPVYSPCALFVSCQTIERQPCLVIPSVSLWVSFDSCIFPIGLLLYLFKCWYPFFVNKIQILLHLGPFSPFWFLSKERNMTTWACVWYFNGSHINH